MGVQLKTDSTGASSFLQPKNFKNMKAFVAMFAAVASAAAEPWLGYGYAGVPLVYGKSAPCVNAANQPVPCAAGHVLLGKREAEAEAEPWLGYGYAGVPLVHPYNLGVCTNYLGQRVP